jgi:hypothetical protein
MEKLFSLVSQREEKRVETLSETSVLFSSITSYLDIIHHRGKVSTMNYHLLLLEINKLKERIDILITKDMPYDRKRKVSTVVDEFTFSDSFFSIEENIKDTNQVNPILKDTSENIKDTDSDKKESKEKENKEPVSKSKGHSVNKPKRKETSSTANQSKELRHENILKILKQKKDAKIGDISALIKDCSSKTIQRDLNELVAKSLVTKQGDRRWSVYNLAY